MRLESIALQNISESYSYKTGPIISFKSMFKEVLDDLAKGLDKGVISSKFHNTVINVIFAAVSEIRNKTGIDTVVLSGGTFQNVILLEGTENILKENNFMVLAHEAVPSNDGGLALGQLAIAAKRRESECV